MSSPPALSHSDVRNWTEQRFYDRGKTYFQEDRIQRPRREGRILKAECQGSQPSPYHVEATLDDDGIAEAVCSCPMGEGGYSPETTSSPRSGRCKHVVALLLTWVESPDTFEAEDPLKRMLREQSADTLVSLILKMVERHPDLERLLRLSITSTGPAIDPEELRGRIRSTFENRGHSYDHYHRRNPHQEVQAVANDLEPFFTQANDYRHNGRPYDAATVYRLIIEETCDHYENFHDEHGELADQVSNAVQGLGATLSDTDNSDLRESILRALFDAYVWDLDLGGYGPMDEARAAILEHATADERPMVADWVRDQVPDQGPEPDTDRRVFVMTKDDTSSWDTSWKRDTLGDFLFDLLADTLDDEEYLRICRQTGRVTELVDRLLANDRLDEALDAAREASDEEVYQLKSTFAEHGVEDALYDLALDWLGDDPHLQLLTWVRNYAQEHGDLDRALRLSKRLFWTHTNVDAYERLRTVARRLNRWDAVQAEIHDQLREQDDYGLLTRLHLANDNIEAALEILPKADSSFSWSYNRSPLPIAVAEAAEEEYPEEAIRIYTERGRSLIAERGRDNYQDAAELFQRVKALYDQHQPGAWDDVLEALYDDELHRLPAARDEFEKADLL